LGIDTEADNNDILPAPPTPPQPTDSNNTLIPDENGNYVETNEKGVPKGEWSWDVKLQEWVYEPYTPSGNLPQTGYNSYLLYLIPLLVLSLGEAVITARRVARKR